MSNIKSFVIKYALALIAFAAVAYVAMVAVTPAVYEVDYGESHLSHLRPMKDKDGNRPVEGTAYVVKYMAEFTPAESERFAEKIMHIRQKLTLKDKVVVQVESPGGAPMACSHSFGLLMDIRRVGVQVVTVSDYVAASCGYMLMSAGTKAYSAPGAMIGNIGVYIQHSGKKLPVIGNGRIKELLAGDAPILPGDEAILKDRLARMAAEFHGTVIAGRGKALKPSDYQQAFSGDIFSGREARKLGLVDRNMDVRSLLSALKIGGYRIINVEFRPGALSK